MHNSAAATTITAAATVAATEQIQIVQIVQTVYNSSNSSNSSNIPNNSKGKSISPHSDDSGIQLPASSFRVISSIHLYANSAVRSAVPNRSSTCIRSALFQPK